ncbi:MAG: rRNA adenine dimethyltransferase family protein [Candidatus Pacebacteria bacterium]|nr:rRNA adenine dimethyltransferase family protein [Candidatus Paceibacterota bacterium]
MPHPKKSLGQNFLTSPDIVRDIVEAGEVSPEDTILEIGPGTGMLTKALLDKVSSGTGGKVVAVEKDDRLIDELREKFGEEIRKNKLSLIHGDIADAKNILGKAKLFEKPFKLIANIPYYITGEILRMFLSGDHQPTSIVVLVQKEVAERIVGGRTGGTGSKSSKQGRSGKPPAQKENLLSLSVKVYGVPSYVRTVKAGAFFPKPNVDSAVLKIDKISKNFFKDISEELFFELIHAGFAHKRKMLLGNINPFFKKIGLNPSDTVKIFEEIKLDTKIRAEDVTLEQWRNLTRLYTRRSREA